MCPPSRGEDNVVSTTQSPVRTSTSGYEPEVDDGTLTLHYSDFTDYVYQAIWAAGLHGLLNYVSDNKVKAGIDQAFDQSPYLRVGGQR